MLSSKYALFDLRYLYSEYLALKYKSYRIVIIKSYLNSKEFSIIK